MEAYNLDSPLLKVGEQGGSSIYWTARNAVEGLQIFGGIGSGKTSGSGRTIALKYLKAGFGGLILTVKPDEKKLWQEYCKLAGREADLIIVDPTQKNFFNFLDYEGGEQAMTENVVQVLKTVIRAGDEAKGSNNSDPFWGEALDLLLYNLIDLCKLAYGRIEVEKMYDILQAMSKVSNDYARSGKPNAFQQAMNLAVDNVQEKVKAWQDTFTSDSFKALKTNPEYEQLLQDAVPDARIYSHVSSFCLEKFPALPDKTRMTIEFSVVGLLFRLLRDPVFSLFCRHTSTFTPDDCLIGKIILLNLPIKVYHKIGRDSQIMFKYIWQRAMEKGEPDESRMPVFLWADEAQNFLHEHDAATQATARSSRIATVYLSQNLPNYHANMGSAKYKHLVDSFLGTLATKIFHANADIETNRYSSDLIGDVAFEETSMTGSMQGQYNLSRTRSLRIDKAVRPEIFLQLKTGSPKNNYQVECYIHTQAMSLKHELNYNKIEFDQNFNL